MRWKAIRPSSRPPGAEAHSSKKPFRTRYWNVRVQSPPRIAPLADHPQTLPLLKTWFESEWPGYYGPGGPGNAEADLRAYANRTGLPVALVAFLGSELCGVAALKAQSIPTHSHLGPWVAAGLVGPSYRGRGIGTELTRAIEQLAKSLGYCRLYCATSTANRLLDRLGWQLMERISHEGENVSVYRKEL